ncbi:MAG TPA: extracellular solute-binding protein [Aggregatilineales bacterium]|nr:extracellular solute-binding protein [Aggregatilineales bacterium]
MRKGYRFSLIIALAAMITTLSLSGIVANAQATAAPVTINMWHISTAAIQGAYWQTIANDYMAQHPNVTIQFTVLENEAYKAKLTTVIQAGTPPDLFWSWGGGVLWNYANAGLVRDISPELNANNGEWKNSFAAQAALNLYGQNGKYYGVPFDWGAVGVFFNKALWKKAGLDPAKTPATWDDLLTDVKALKAAGITPFIIGEKDKWPGHFFFAYLATREAGQKGFLAAYNQTGSFADAPFVKAFTDLKQLVDLNAFQDGALATDYSTAENLMGDGKGAMEVMGQFSIANQINDSTSKKGLGADLGWFPFPVITGGTGLATDVFGGGDGLAVGKNAPDAAVDFLKFASSTKYQIMGADPNIGVTVPPTVKGTDSAITDPILQTIIKARDSATYFQLYYDQFLPPATAGAVLDSVQAVFAGTDTPQQAAQAIQDAAKTELPLK